MPKSKCTAWEYFKCEVIDKKKIYKCIFCNTKYSRNATRITSHLAKCIKCPMQIKTRFVKHKDNYSNNSNNNNETVTFDATSSAISANTSFSSTSNSISNQRESSNQSSFIMDKFLDKTTITEKDKLDELLARAIYSSGCPIALTENRNWINFFSTLRPSYKLPSRFQLANGLLNNEFRNIEAFVMTKVNKAFTLGIQCDGWSNIRNQSVINFILTTPEPVMFKTLFTDCERHTAEYLSQELIKIIEEVGPEKFFGIVTDNAAPMEKAKSLIENKYNFIQTYSCISHTLNLLVSDLMNLNSLKHIEACSKEIVKEVTGSHVSLAQFNKIQLQNYNKVLSLKLPVKTRWGSILNCINSLITCKGALQMLMVTEVDNLKFSRNVKQNCLDDEIFWLKLQKVAVVLTPIVKWITLLEGNTFKISQVIEGFKDIENIFTENIPLLPISKSEEKECFSKLEKRKKMAVKPVHYAANLLDPTLTGQSLTSEEHILAMQCIDKILSSHPKFINRKDKIFTELTKYCARTDLWSMDFIWLSARSVDCISWWKGICSKTDLKDLAIAVLGLPASSAETERSFSTYSFIHTKRRNRLSIDRAGKLMYVAHNHKLLTVPNKNEVIGMDTASAASATITITDLEPGPEEGPISRNNKMSETESNSSDSDYTLHDTDSSMGEEDFSDLQAQE